MNFLAHAYLSFDYEPLIIGNMISDFVKGKKKYDFDEDIQKGIALHRSIDTFTDDHPLVKEAKEAFRAEVGLYAGAFVDVSFDYFLANDPQVKTAAQWQQFSQKIYSVLIKNSHLLPQKFLMLLPWMVREDWLFNYRFEQGMKNSFRNVVKKAKFLDDDVDVFPAFNENRQLLAKKYTAFFPELYSFAKNNAYLLMQ